MTSAASAQLDLLGSNVQPLHPRKSSVLGVAVDTQGFLQFLSEEWLHPKEMNWLVLGTTAVSAERTQRESAVTIWFDVQKLPDTTVMSWGNGKWSETTLRNLKRDDGLLAWSGPLPLFAVDHFEVNSESARAQHLALARNFADITMPTQPVNVGEGFYVASPSELPSNLAPWTPPENWDAIRGAAAMASYAVPAIDPWVDLLCQVLRDDGEALALAEQLHAPWWKMPLWSPDVGAREDLPGLWRAIVDEFSQPGRLREWRANAILESICEKALALGEDKERVQRLRLGAIALLGDHGTVEEVASVGDNLSLTLQLLLLRPSPEKFLGWREDWAAIPPVVWWTGMTLAGYLQGYRSLPKQFRGTSESQRLLALKTWQLAGDGGSGPWSKLTAKQVTWIVGEDTLVLLADRKPWEEHKLGTRGHWFRADFGEQSIHDEAESIAQQACPDAIIRVVTLTDVSVLMGGSGVAKVSAKARRLDVKGVVDLQIGQGAVINNRLDVSRFRDWLATASITQRIRRPPGARKEILLSVAETGISTIDTTRERIKSVNPKITKKPNKWGNVSASVIAAPLGLRLLREFISPEEEKQLVTTIDSLEWDRSMKRRVQHFGWKYDYRARKVDPKNYLGPLPLWAQDLAERLFELNVVSELPDQVIVNNYDGKQGITKHIDCPDCFRGPVVTISLLEAWDMVFTRKLENGTSERFVQTLPKCSAAVLAGESRSTWSHEIPARLLENGVPRVRRVSITFRKVATPISE